jgi:ABC-2 type transport system permease protein
MMSAFVVNLILPLIALVVGTSALGQEIEDGTAVYLLAKPLSRWKVVIAKIAAAAVVVAALCAFAVAGAGLPVLIGREADLIIPGFVLAVALGALTYSALFVSLSVRFGRALVIGLGYVFVWEALISQFIPGVRFLSVRAYTLGVADTIVDVAGVSFGNIPNLPQSLVFMAVLVALATWYAVRRLQAFELGERV